MSYDAIIITPISCAGRTYPIGSRVTCGNLHNDHRRVTFAPDVEAVIADEHIMLMHSQIVAEATRLCVACGDNEVDCHDALCDQCVTRAFVAITIERGISRLLEADERIAAVIDYDNNERNNANASGMPYVSINDAAWDWASGESDESLQRIVCDWAVSIVNAAVVR